MNAPDWKAGAAATVITPTEPMWLAGWAARRQPATSKAMDLYAKALALEDAQGRRLVIVTADLIAIPATLAAAVAARITARRQLPRERLLFNASHTHTGPEIRPDKVPFFEIPPEFAARIGPYVGQLGERLASVIEAALDRLEPATLRVRQLHAGFAENRRNSAGPSDHDVPVLEVRGAAGAITAIVFGYACHNLTLPPTFCEFHGDYAGIAQRRLEKKIPGATALFLAGAGADQDPEPRGTAEAAHRHGEALADTVAGGLGQPGRDVVGGLDVAFETVTLDLQPLPPPAALQDDIESEDLPRRRKAEFLLAALKENRPLPATVPCPVQVVRFGGELLLVALAGEPVVDYARRLKAELAAPFVWVAGYSNDLFGYLPTRRVAREGGYEGGRAALWSALPMPLADTAEERIVDAVRRLVTCVLGSS